MNMDILIVDDDSSVRNPMNEFVKLSGYNSFEASSAEEAIDILKTNSIQVVITDIMLPEMSGFELTELIIKEYDSSVIIITGYSDIYSYEEAIKAGASDFIIKPVRRAVA